jgi:hypothetical protein
MWHNANNDYHLPIAQSKSEVKSPHAPLARAESDDLEIKRLQLSFKQNETKIQAKNQVSDEHSISFKRLEGEPDGKYVNKTKPSLNYEDIDMNISLSPLSLSITKPWDYKKSGKTPAPYKFKSNTTAIVRSDERDEKLSVSPEKIFYEAEDSAEDKGKSRKIKRKKSGSKNKPQLISNRSEIDMKAKHDDKKPNKSLDNLVISSHENTQTSSKADDSDSCAASTSPVKTSPTGIKIRLQSMS